MPRSPAPPHHAATLAGLLALALLLTGCTSLPGTPDGRLDFDIEEGKEVPQDGVLTTNVTFTARGRALQVETPEDCLRVEVFVRGTAIPVMLEDDDPPRCRDRESTQTIPAGATRSFGPFRLILAEYVTQGAPLFTPGTYELVARFVGEPSRETEGTTTFEVRPAEELPRIEIEPEHAQWVAGEEVRITASFVNTADRAFRYTSNSACNDIEVRVLDARGDGMHTRLWDEDGPYACAQVMTNFTVGPGASVTAEVVWDGSQGGHGPPYVAEGVWVLEARFGGTAHNWDVVAREPVSILHPDG